MENPFVKLFAIDFKDHLEVKKSGNTELKYVSWAYAWAEVKKLYPAASYEVKKFNGLPYVYDPITGFMVYTTVAIEGVSHEMWLPVLDGANKAMKAVPYTYTTPKWDYNPQTRRREKIGMEERTVEAASKQNLSDGRMIIRRVCGTGSKSTTTEPSRLSTSIAKKVFSFPSTAQ